MQLPELMWSADQISKIWFKALISFIVVIVLGTWCAMNFVVEPKAFQSFDWTHITLVLGALGIVSIGGVSFNKENANEKTTETSQSALIANSNNFPTYSGGIASPVSDVGVGQQPVQ